MTVSNKKRATSILTPVPSSLRSPTATSQTTETTMTSNSETEDRTSVRKRIMISLRSDVTAIKAARRKAQSVWEHANLTYADLNEKQTAAALNKIQERKLAKRHVGCKYPVFENYIPAPVYGKHASETADQQDRLVEKQLDVLCGRMHRKRFEPDDEKDDAEQMPAIKKKESEETPDVNGVEPHVANSENRSAKPDMASRQDTPLLGRGIRALYRTSKNMRDPSTSVDEGDEEDESGSEDSDKSEAELASEEEEDNVSEEEEEEDLVPLVAVSRGRPLAKDTPSPVRAYKNLKQHFATGIKCIEKAVVRGQVLCNNNCQADAACEGNKSVTSRKRARGVSECSARKVKKVKVDMDA